MEKKMPSFFAAVRSIRMPIYQKQYEFCMDFPLSKRNQVNADRFQEEIFRSSLPLGTDESNQLTAMQKFFNYNGNIYCRDIGYVGRF